MSAIDCTNCGRVVADGYELCTLCADALHRELLTVPGLVHDMTITRSRLDRLSRGRVGGKSSETALPVRLNRFDEPSTRGPLNHLTLVIGTWARVAADNTGQADALDVALDSTGLRQLVHNRRTVRLDRAALSTEGAYDVELAAVWLACCGGDLRTVPDAGVMHDEITDALASARRAVDRRPELLYRGRCGARVADEHGVWTTCDADLYVEKGEAYVTCPACSAPHDIQGIEHSMLEREDDRLCTLPELLAILRGLGDPVPKATLYAWANDRKRKRLVVRGWRTPNGMVTPYWIRRTDPAVYRLGDVRGLAAATRRQTG